jgi:hypothetical protein
MLYRRPAGDDPRRLQYCQAVYYAVFGEGIVRVSVVSNSGAGELRSCSDCARRKWSGQKVGLGSTTSRADSFELNRANPKGGFATEAARSTPIVSEMGDLL